MTAEVGNELEVILPHWLCSCMECGDSLYSEKVMLSKAASSYYLSRPSSRPSFESHIEQQVECTDE